MRLWTLHPQYLDAQGLVALWREALLAQKVLQGGTLGYRHHPQLDRFQQEADPVAAIATYLRSVHGEAVQRGYRFDGSKIAVQPRARRMRATRGQMRYEWQHLKRKLRVRDRAHYRALLQVKRPKAHPLFTLVDGDVESWEKKQRRPALIPLTREQRRRLRRRPVRYAQEPFCRKS